MNTSYDEDQNNLRYAEYVLGVLDADARASVTHEVATSDEVAVAVALWQRRLTPLVDALPEVTPSEDVWTRIRQELSWDAPRGTTRPGSFWSNARPWQWLSVAASLVAAFCVVMLLRAPVREAHEAGHVAVMVSSIRQDNGVTDWTATMDLDRKQIVVVPATTPSVPTGRSTQLWLIPAGGAPISVGVFAPDTTAVLPLSAQLLAKLGPTAVLAVSVEPPGGSPTGQPTGPVIAKGAISGAPAPAVAG
jgi:anti-sigma-K factor RskA